MKHYKKIVTIVPRRLGDAMFRLPVFRLIRKAYPDAEIDAIVRTSLAAEVLENNPNIHAVFVSPDEDKIKILKNEYELIINLDNEEESAKIERALNGERTPLFRDNYKDKHRIEKFAQFYSDVFGVQYELSDLYYDLYPQEKHAQAAKEILKKANIFTESDVIVGFHVGCHSMAKSSKSFFGLKKHGRAWPAKNFVSLAKKIEKNYPKVKIILTGSKEEEKIGCWIERKSNNVVSLISKMSLMESAALMKFLTLYISNDTGMLHLASASDVPIIALFGDDLYQEAYPYPLNSNRFVIHAEGIQNISVQEVFDKIKIILFDVAFFKQPD